MASIRERKFRCLQLLAQANVELDDHPALCLGGRGLPNQDDAFDRQLQFDRIFFGVVLKGKAHPVIGITLEFDDVAGAQ